MGKVMIAVLWVALAASTVAQPSPSLGNRDSLEWAAMDSTVIVRGKIESVREGSNREAVIIATVVIDETLKGDVKGKLEFAIESTPPFDQANPFECWKKDRKELLLFLIKNGERPEAPDYSRFAPYGAHTGRITGNILVLDKADGIQAVRMDLTPLSSPEQILSMTRTVIKGAPSKPQMIRLPSAPSVLQQCLPGEWRGPAGLRLAVPLTDEMRTIVQKWQHSNVPEWQSLGNQTAALIKKSVASH